MKWKARHRITNLHRLNCEQIEELLEPYTKAVKVEGSGRGKQIMVDLKDGYKIEIQNMDILVSTNL